MAQAATAGKSPGRKNRLVKSLAAEPAALQTETVRPSMARLTAVVALCFLAGAAWPWLGGPEFVQRPPGSTAKAADGEASPSEAESTPSGALSTPGEVPALHATPMLTTTEALRIERRVMQSCHGNAGEAVAHCDEPNLDPVLDEPLAELATCDAAEDVEGVLSLGLHIDFTRGLVARAKAGQSTTVSKAKAAALIACAEKVVVGTPLEDIEHEHAGYWVYYLVRFLPPGSPIDPASAPPPPQVVSASGRATIGWSTAIVREKPAPRAKVAARLSYGTRVSVSGRVGDWYRIEHRGKELGWVHAKAIGL